MKIVIGLGNPGDKYEKTRHNLGFLVIDELIKANNLQPAVYGKKFNSLISENVLDDKKIILAKPQTYMNNSGETVELLADYYKIKSEDILVVHDDIDLTIGKIFIQKDRSSAGHKGVQSIMDILKTKDFKRIRIGIRPKNKEQKIDTEKFVLEKFTDEEEKIIQETIKKSAEMIFQQLL